MMWLQWHDVGETQNSVCRMSVFVCVCGLHDACTHACSDVEALAKASTSLAVCVILLLHMRLYYDACAHACCGVEALGEASLRMFFV